MTAGTDVEIPDAAVDVAHLQPRRGEQAVRREEVRGPCRSCAGSARSHRRTGRRRNRTQAALVLATRQSGSSSHARSVIAAAGSCWPTGAEEHAVEATRAFVAGIEAQRAAIRLFGAVPVPVAGPADFARAPRALRTRSGRSPARAPRRLRRRRAPRAARGRSTRPRPPLRAPARRAPWRRPGRASGPGRRRRGIHAGPRRPADSSDSGPSGSSDRRRRGAFRSTASARGRAAVRRATERTICVATSDCSEQAVRHRPFVRFGPQLCLAARFDELGGDAHAIRHRFARCLRRDSARAGRRRFRGRCGPRAGPRARRAGDHAEPVGTQAAELRDQLFGEAAGKRLGRARFAEVAERQHGEPLLDVAAPIALASACPPSTPFTRSTRAMKR